MKQATNWLVLVTLMFALTACQTSKQVAGKTLVTTAMTVDKAMKGWATWVSVQRNNPAVDQLKLLNKENLVRNAYEKYQASIEMARKAYLTMNATETPEYTAAASDLRVQQAYLISVITEITK